MTAAVSSEGASGVEAATPLPLGVPALGGFSRGEGLASGFCLRCLFWRRFQVSVQPEVRPRVWFQRLTQEPRPRGGRRSLFGCRFGLGRYSGFSRWRSLFRSPPWRGGRVRPGWVSSTLGRGGFLNRRRCFGGRDGFGRSRILPAASSTDAVSATGVSGAASDSAEEASSDVASASDVTAVSAGWQPLLIPSYRRGGRKRPGTRFSATDSGARVRFCRRSACFGMSLRPRTLQSVSAGGAAALIPSLEGWS